MPHHLAAVALCLTASIGLTAEPLCVAKGLYIGAEPADATTWASLAEIGVQTVVGVDGLPPDKVAADAAGVRVVHVPIGYGAVPDDALDQLSTVARDCDRPLYVYCHHGKHRGPAAAAIVCRAAGLLDRDGALDMLRTAGTDPAYAGLWNSVAEFDPTRPVPEATRLVSRSEVSPLRLAMGQLDRAWDTILSDDPRADRKAALVVARQALRESGRAAVATQDNRSLVRDFDEALRVFETLTVGGADRVRRFEKACIECHQQHRD